MPSAGAVRDFPLRRFGFQVGIGNIEPQIGNIFRCNEQLEPAIGKIVGPLVIAEIEIGPIELDPAFLAPPIDRRPRAPVTRARPRVRD